MSMIDTWAATGAGAFSLSENGLYTLEGWRAFLSTLNDRGFFTVSRWYNPGDVNETGRMIGLATAALLDAGVPDARPHLFVARRRIKSQRWCCPSAPSRLGSCMTYGGSRATWLRRLVGPGPGSPSPTVLAAMVREQGHRRPEPR